MTDTIAARLRGTNMHWLDAVDIKLEAADHIDAQDAKIKALQAELTQWKHAVGHLLAAVPVSEIVGVGGSITDLANWMKTRHKDAAKLKALVELVTDAVEEDDGEYVLGGGWHAKAAATLAAAKENQNGN